MIKNLDFSEIKDTAWLIFVSLSLVSLLGPWWICNYYLACSFFVFATLLWVLYLVYWCERYFVFAMTFFICFCLIMMSMCWASMFFLSTELGLSRLLQVLLPIFSAASVSISFIVIYFSKSNFFHYIVEGDRVELGEWKTGAKAERVRFLILAIIILVACFLGGFYLKASMETAILAVLTPLLTQLMLLAARHKIRGLRMLRAQEKKGLFYYRFMLIDEIREARKKCWPVHFANFIIDSIERVSSRR